MLHVYTYYDASVTTHNFYYLLSNDFFTKEALGDKSIEMLVFGLGMQFLP